MSTSTFTAEEFWPAFVDDIEQAKGLIVIQSPFITSRRLTLLSKTIKNLSAKGVTVCVFVQKPRDWETGPAVQDAEAAFRNRELRFAIETLGSWGVHVNLRSKIHAKFALIDAEILWEGSLNILSHSYTKEHMRRWRSKSELRATKLKHALTECSDCRFNQSRYVISHRDSEQMPGLSRLLSEHRRHLNLSQRSLARKSGLPHSRVSRLEAGDNITVRTLFQISKELECEVFLVPKLFVPSVASFLQQREDKQFEPSGTSSIATSSFNEQ